MVEPSENIFSVLKPMLYVIRIFGIAPLNLSEILPKYSRKSISWCVLILCCLLIGQCGIYKDMWNRKKFFNELIPLIICDILSSIITTLITLYTFYFNAQFLKNLSQLIDDFADVDEDLLKITLGRLISVKRSHRKNKIVFLAASVLIWLFLIQYVYQNISTTEISEIQFYHYCINIFNYASSFLPLFMTLQFCSFVVLLYHRFVWLLEKIIHFEKVIQNSNQMSLEESNKFLASTIAVYIKLCDIATKLNKVYSLHILMAFLAIVLDILALMSYLLVWIYLKYKVDTQLPSVFSIALPIVFFGGNIFFMAFICSRTTGKAAEVSSLIKTLFSGNLFGIEVLPSVLQTRYYKVEFSACNLFCINMQIIYALIGAIATYSLIVFDFSISNFLALKLHILN